DLPPAQRAFDKGVRGILEERQVINVVHHQHLRAVQVRGSAPPRQIVIVIHGHGKVGGGGVVDVMRPRVGGLEGQAVPERMTEVHLQRVVFRHGRVLLDVDRGVATVGDEEDISTQLVVDENGLGVAVSARVAIRRVVGRGERRDLHGANADRYLVEVTLRTQMSSQTADVTYLQDVVAREFVLHAQIELLDAAPLLLVWDSGEAAGTEHTGDDVVVTENIVAGGRERHRRVSFSAFGVRLVAIAALEINAVAAANDRLAGTRRIVGKAEAWRQGGVIRLPAAGRHPIVATLNNTLPARHLVIASSPHHDTISLPL